MAQMSKLGGLDGTMKTPLIRTCWGASTMFFELTCADTWDLRASHDLLGVSNRPFFHDLTLVRVACAQCPEGSDHQWPELLSVSWAFRPVTDVCSLSNWFVRCFFADTGAGI